RLSVSMCCTRPPPTALRPLSLHDALPISECRVDRECGPPLRGPLMWGYDLVDPSSHRALRSRGTRPRRLQRPGARRARGSTLPLDRKSTRLNSSHVQISYAVFCLKQKTTP